MSFVFVYKQQNNITKTWFIGQSDSEVILDKLSWDETRLHRFFSHFSFFLESFQRRVPGINLDDFKLQSE